MSSLPPFTLLHPASLAEASLALRDGAVLVAGGCALIPALRSGAVKAPCLVSFDRIPGLNTLSAHPRSGLQIGAQVRAARLLPDIWTGKRFAAVHEAVEQFDAPHIARMATVAGNLCAARADHDLPVALVAMGAEVTLQGAGAARKMALADFLLAPDQTALAPGEILTLIACPGPGTDGGSAFKKLPLVRRRADAPRRLSAAATIRYGVERERIQAATLVLGGVCLPWRAAQDGLLGELADPALFQRMAEAAAAQAPALAHADAPLRRQAIALMRDCLQQANARALARHDHFDDADDLAAESA